MVINIYGRPNCQWCTAATSLLDRKGWTYSYSNLFAIDPVEAQAILDRSGMRTVPMVEVDGTFIGGYDQLEQYIRNVEERQM